MSNCLERLADWGCDVAGALDRMADDEGFYLECLHEVAEDPCFEQLEQALAEGNTRGAFDAAHALKGVLANVGLTPMHDQITQIVEPLRKGRNCGLSRKLRQLAKMRARLVDILAEESSGRENVKGEASFQSRG